MRVLSNRHECFAQRVASGDAGAAAYRTAFGTEGASAESGGIAAAKKCEGLGACDRIAERERNHDNFGHAAAPGDHGGVCEPP